MKTIDLAIAKEMVARYASTRKTIIDTAYGIDDTTGVWFTVDEIKDYVNSLPASAAGVKIHFGVYDDAQSPYPKHTTLIFTATDANDNDVIGGTIGDPIGYDPANHGKVCPPDCV